MNFTVLVGNPKPASRTLGVAVAAADALSERLDLRSAPEIVDLAGLARRLLLPEPSAAIEDALDVVRSADLLLVASPTFKGTYSGLLKVFLDRLPYRGLAAATALPLLVMNSPHHAYAVETHLRPLLTELGAAVPVPGLAVLESDLGALAPLVRSWAGTVSDALRDAAVLSGHR